MMCVAPYCIDATPVMSSTAPETGDSYMLQTMAQVTP
jgi:hypothetical protein